LLELADYRSADVTRYQDCYGTAASVARVAVDGGATIGLGTFETTADIEDVAGLAPYAAISVFEAPDTTAGDLADLSAIVNSDSAAVASTSWGDCEPDVIAASGVGYLQAENTLLQTAAAQGQTVLAASGDSGSEACNPVDGSDAVSVDDPAAQPYVTAVGGTEWSGTGPSRLESAWDQFQGATGGGYSAIWAQPDWQTGPGVGAAPGDPCGASSGACREVPDVAALAGTPFYVFYCTAGDCADTRGWSTGSGTSFAAPLWAALVTLTAGGCGAGRLGFLDPTLYALAASRGGAHDFRDVTIGDNDFTKTYEPPKWLATAGYDPVTGLGTPVASNGAGRGLVAGLCAAVAG
jgi:subtilase family serine protease